MAYECYACVYARMLEPHMRRPRFSVDRAHIVTSALLVLVAQLATPAILVSVTSSASSDTVAGDASFAAKATMFLVAAIYYVRASRMPYKNAIRFVRMRQNQQAGPAVDPELLTVFCREYEDVWVCISCTVFFRTTGCVDEFMNTSYENLV
ncbi:hypothetical protein JKP88DRAFT_222357, partial [Tribonema minus]